MPAEVLSHPCAEALAQERAEELRYVARQPILDTQGKVCAYELLFRDGPKAAFCGEGDQATRTMLDNTVVFGLERLTGGLPAFVNCTMDSLLEHQVEVLPPKATVLEVLESVQPNEAIIAACKDLKLKGFRIALDDFTWSAEIAPLLELADYIKVDFLAIKAAARQELLRRIRSSKASLLAEKIESQDDFRLAREEGFTFFQGYYFFRPTLITNRKVPSTCMLHMAILKQLQTEPLDLRELGQLVKRDPSLTVRLLRLANSPICAVRMVVQSIQSAMVVLGDEMLRRVLTLAIATEWNAGRPAAILHIVFVRGRFCELAAALCALTPSEQYLLGMLSLLPAMLRMPMSELTPTLGLRESIREALEGSPNQERILLQWLESHERGDWAACAEIVRTHCLHEEQLLRCYTEAVLWADTVLSSAS
jgi:EAL and modified HD-GYP domain-containing signal transduction protein